MLEQYWGVSRFIIIYFLAGIMGSMWSCVISPLSISVGASGIHLTDTWPIDFLFDMLATSDLCIVLCSGALFGLLGAELTWLYLNWNDMNPHGRTQELCSVITILLINFLLGFVGPNIGIVIR